MTAEETRSEAEAEQGASPFVAYAVREVPFDAPYSWLAAGWRDMWRVPRVSLAYGAIFAVTGLVLAVGLTQVGLQSLILVLAGGFILVGPMLAAGLYETSRRLEKGEPVSLASTLRAGFYGGGQLAHMGLLLMLIYLAWVEIALLPSCYSWGRSRCRHLSVRFEPIAHAAGIGSLDRRHRGWDGVGDDGLRRVGGRGAAAPGRACRRRDRGAD
jgi:hypothetical protein